MATKSSIVFLYCNTMSMEQEYVNSTKNVKGVENVEKQVGH